MAPHKIVTYFFSGKAIDHGTEISPERFTRMIFTMPRNCPNFKYPHDLIFKIHDIIPELSMTLISTHVCQLHCYDREYALEPKTPPVSVNPVTSQKAR